MNTKLLEKFSQIEEKHWWWEGRRKLVRQLLDNSQPRKILDIGCGTGETLSFLKKLYPKSGLYGADSSPMAVKFALNRGHKNIFLAKAEQLSFPDNYFDIILLLDVLEHISDDLSALKEAKRVLKPGGKIIITAPGLSFVWSDHDSLQGHKRRYTRHEIITKANKVGLNVSFISYFNFIFSLPIIAIRVFSRLKMFKKLTDYDNTINYDIAGNTLINQILTRMFITEISLIKFIPYPFGISVVALLQKPPGSVK